MHLCLRSKPKLHHANFVTPALPPLACNYGQSVMYLCEVKYEKFLKRKHMCYSFGPAFGCCTLQFLDKICFFHIFGVKAEKGKN